jgi:hypothetical protein
MAKVVGPLISKHKALGSNASTKAKEKKDYHKVLLCSSFYVSSISDLYFNSYTKVSCILHNIAIFLSFNWFFYLKQHSCI